MCWLQPDSSLGMLSDPCQPLHHAWLLQVCTGPNHCLLCLTSWQKCSPHGCWKWETFGCARFSPVNSSWTHLPKMKPLGWEKRLLAVRKGCTQSLTEGHLAQSCALLSACQTVQGVYILQELSWVLPAQLGCKICLLFSVILRLLLLPSARMCSNISSSCQHRSFSS